MLPRLTQNIAANLIFEVADLQFVSGLELSLDHSLAIDPHAIGASQIPDHQIIVDLGDAAMPSRDFFGIQLNIALLMTTKEQNRLVDEDTRAIAERKQVCGHGDRGVGAAIDSLKQS